MMMGVLDCGSNQELGKVSGGVREEMKRYDFERDGA